MMRISEIVDQRSFKGGADVRRLSRVLMLIGAVLLVPRGAWAQVEPDTLVVEEDVEAALEDLDEETGNAAQLAELLAELAQNPLDVNAASGAELAQIPAISPLLAQSIVQYRAQLGPFASLPELRNVPGITEAVFLNARPYLRVGVELEEAAEEPSLYPPAPTLQEALRDLQFEVIQRAERRLDYGRGYLEDVYLGSPNRVYTRIKARAGRQVSLNATLEKDPGEPFRWNPETGTYGYDYFSAHVALRDAGRIKALVLGDYIANFGQGVVLWRSSAFGKGREPVRPVVREGRGILPYGSVEENRFLRGVAATVAITPSLDVSAFASRRRLDASFLEPDTTDDIDDELAEVRSLYTTGLHRRSSEIDRKDVLGESLVGGAVDVRAGPATFGVVGYHNRFDDPIAPGDQAYEFFDFAGQQATMVSLYGSAFLRSLYLFGEVARGEGGAVGGIGGAQVGFGSRAEAVVLARHYGRDFNSLHGYAFGERSGATQNETGFYLGLKLRPEPRWTVAAYFDQYRFPWLRFAVYRPSTGHEALVMVEHKASRWLSFYVQARTETKEVGTRVTDGLGRELRALAPETRQSLRLHGDYTLSRDVRLRARVETTRFLSTDEPDRFGLLLYQDVRWLPRRWLQVDVRLAFFDVDDYDARVYAYENDLLYTFAVPAFNGRGQRAYVLFKITPHDRLSLQVKYAETRFEDVRTVGSGLDEAEGNRLREVRAQLRWQF